MKKKQNPQNKKTSLIIKIFRLLKDFKNLTKDYHLGVLASSITFYIILTIIPLMILIMQVLNASQLIFLESLQGLIGHFKTYWWTTIIFLVNFVWTTSAAIHNLNLVSDMIFTQVKKRSAFKLRISSFIFMFLFIGLLVFLLIASNIISTYLKVFNQYQLIWSIGEFIFNFIIVSLLTGVVYRYILPIKLRFKEALIQSMVVTVSWFLATIVMQQIISYFGMGNYNNLYQVFASVFVIIYWLFLMSYLFLLSLIISYHLYKKRL